MTWLLSILLLAAVAPCETAVCRCRPFTVEEAAERADEIFTATVTSVREILPGDPDLPAGRYEVRMRVHSAWKGAGAVEVILVSGRTSCDIQFGAGEDYLVYGHTGLDGVLYAHACTGTRRLVAGASPPRSLGEPVRRWP